ncbi:MAG: amidohydrolase family protein [Phycisphaerae bacterium]|nr:amidohydrolase family protein [Phycisphaerae bacterium]
MTLLSTGSGQFANPSNRFGVDYRREAAFFAALPYPIVDAHAHVIGLRAAPLLLESMDAYGVGSIYSMSRLEEVDGLRAIFGERIRFIAMPDFANPDRRVAHGPAYVQRIRDFHREGARIAKFWAAPRGIDLGRDAGDGNLLRLDSPNRRQAMDEAAALGMMFMTHVADPDTWFSTRYKDASVYGTKRSHYEPLERLLDEYRVPWIAAHMGGSPEDLAFLDQLLGAHDNLSLDASATKWMVRELSKHPQRTLVEFLTKWRGRILFGSDIVTSDEHLKQGDKPNEMAAKASDRNSAFDLYASRYWALRALWESSYAGESPISDPDLAMIDPARHELDAPALHGKALDPVLLRSLYHDAAEALLEPAHAAVR